MASAATPEKSPAARQKVRLGILFFMLLLFPLLMNYLSVFLIIEGSSKGIMTFSFFFWSAWTVGAFLLGRVACGWICPLGAFQETKDRMVPGKLTRIRYLAWIKYVLAGGWVGSIIWAAVTAGGYHSIDLLYNIDSGVSIDRAEGWIIWGMIAAVVLLPAFLIGRRGFCRYFCPWGVLNMIGAKIKNAVRRPSLHLESTAGDCIQCRTCRSNCPMSLPVTEMVKAGSMNNNECILCGTCADNCPNKAIRFSWRKPQV